MRRTTAIGILALVSCIGSCNSTDGKPISTAFVGISNESTEEDAGLLAYSNFLSISGLVPAQAPAGLAYQPSGSQPTTALGVSPKDSFVVTTTFEVNGETEGGVVDCAARAVALVASAKTKLEEVRQAAADLTLRQLDLLNLKNKFPQANSADLTAREEDLKCARTKFEAAAKAAEGALSQPNVIAIRWNANSAASGGASLGSKLGVKGATNEQSSGTLILAGLRTQTLWIGEDYVRLLGGKPRSAIKDGESTSEFVDREMLLQSAITTFLVQARAAAFVVDSESDARIAAKLEATVRELGNAGDLLLDSDTVNLELAWSRATNLSNAGIISNPLREVRSVPMEPPLEHRKQLMCSLGASDGWVDIYCVKARPNVANSMWVPFAKTYAWKQIADRAEAVNRTSAGQKAERQ